MKTLFQSFSQKTVVAINIVLLMFTQYGCEPFTKLQSLEYTVLFFKFFDESYADYVITVDDYVGYVVYNDSINYFQLEGINSVKLSFFTADSTNICDFAHAEKLIKLHKGYYMMFPYSSVSFNSSRFGIPQVRNLKWDDLCLPDAPYYEYEDEETSRLKLRDTVEILATGLEIFSELYYFEGWDFRKYGRKHPKTMTIKDIVNSINRAIDDGYCNEEKNVLSHSYSPIHQ